LGLRLLPVTVALVIVALVTIALVTIALVTVATASASAPTTPSFSTVTGLAPTTTARWAFEMGVDLDVLLLRLLGARLGATTLGLLVERGQKGRNYELRKGSIDLADEVVVGIYILLERNGILERIVVDLAELELGHSLERSLRLEILV
jgi:hypothetical protein